MRRIPLARLKPGMVVGHNLYNARGDVLLNRGVALTPDYIASLGEIGVPALYIDDGFLSGLEICDVVDTRIRVEAAARLREAWSRKPGPVITLEEEDVRVLGQTVVELLDEVTAREPVMVNLVDLRTQDDYLFAHSVNVCVLALITGLFLGMERCRLLDLGLGALLHDIGKLLLPKEVLNKPGPLFQDEFELVKKHPIYSYEIISGQRDSIGEAAATIALQHHERYNGHGYPCGLSGQAVAELAQIVGIADVYDAMTADRVYRPAHQPNDVYEMLAASGDHYFDFRLVQAFLSNVAAYPAGSVVRLSSGETAVVMNTAGEYPLHPRVRVMFGCHGKPLTEPYEVSLSKQVDLCVIKVLNNDEIEGLRENVLS